MSSHGREAGEDSSEDDDDRGSRGHLGGHSHMDIIIRENIVELFLLGAGVSCYEVFYIESSNVGHSDLINESILTSSDL